MSEHSQVLDLNRGEITGPPIEGEFRNFLNFLVPGGLEVVGVLLMHNAQGTPPEIRIASKHDGVTYETVYRFESVAVVS